MKISIRKKSILMIVATLLLAATMLTVFSTVNSADAASKLASTWTLGTTGAWYYTLTDDGEAANVWCNSVNLTGTVTIPMLLDGRPVISIGGGRTDNGVILWNSRNNVTSVIIPNTVTSINDYAFYNCPGLTSVTIPDSVTSIGVRSFYYCTNLASVTIPSSVTSIGDGAFYNCLSLTSINIPSPVTSISSEMFYNCQNLASVTISDSVTSIGAYAFASCWNLAPITIPDSVTSIDEFAFYSCYDFDSITIPDSLTSISSSLLYNCYNLTSITIPSSVTSIGVNALKNTGITSNDQITYAPYNGRIITGWNTKANGTGEAVDILTATETCYAVTVAYDTTPPTAPSISYNREQNTFTITPGTDTDSGVADTYYKIGNGPWTLYTDTVTLNDGIYDIYAKTSDNAGHESTIATALSVQMYKDALATATAAVFAAELTKKQADVDTAMPLVNALPSGISRTSLLERLDVVQDIIINTPVVIEVPPQPELPPTRDAVKVSVSIVNGTIQLSFYNEGIDGIAYMMESPQIQLLASGNEDYVFKYAEGEHDDAWFETNGTEFTDYFIVTSNNSYSVFAQNIISGNTASASFEITNILSEGSSVVALNQAPTTMNITVPMALPVTMDAAGVVTVADNTAIINRGYGPVEVYSVIVTGTNGWTILPWDTDYSREKVGAQHFSMSINGSPVGADGSVADNIGVIEGFESKAFEYGAKIAPRVMTVDEQQIADVVLVIEWHQDTV